MMNPFSPPANNVADSVPSLPRSDDNLFQPAIRAVLSNGVSIKGSVKFRSELVIDGNVEGTIESIGRLTVGRNAHVRGEIRSRSVTVHGTVDGNLTAGERCELRSGCTLRGDIETSRLVVDENANFIGKAEIAIEDYLSELRIGPKT
jgi:cytoskeletal protein CcmA (bactofilin family)